MGKVASKAVRPVKNFNIENRAQKVLESEKPRPAPRHPSTAAVFENIAQGLYLTVLQAGKSAVFVAGDRCSTLRSHHRINELHFRGNSIEHRITHIFTKI